MRATLAGFVVVVMVVVEAVAVENMSPIVCMLISLSWFCADAGLSGAVVVEVYMYKCPVGIVGGSLEGRKLEKGGLSRRDKSPRRSPRVRSLQSMMLSRNTPTFATVYDIPMYRHDGQLYKTHK